MNTTQPIRITQFIGLLFSITILITGCATGGGDKKPSHVPDDYSLQFQENFSSSDSVNRFVFSSPGDWKRTKKGKRFALEQTKDGKPYKPPHKSPKNIGLINGLAFKSFVLDFDVHQHGRTYDHRDACVFFNFVDPTNYYYTHLGAKRDQQAYQIFIVDDSPRKRITSDPLPPGGVDWESQTWHHVRVIRNGETGKTKVYINNMKTPAMVATDKTHGYGHIGFGSFDDQAMFTNIRIYAPTVREDSASFSTSDSNSK